MIFNTKEEIRKMTKRDASLSATPIATDEKEAVEWVMHMKKRMAVSRCAELGLEDPTLTRDELKKKFDLVADYIEGFNLGMAFFAAILSEASSRDGFCEWHRFQKSETLCLMRGVLAAKNERFEICQADVAAEVVLRSLK